MTHRSAVPVSSAFESIAHGARFRDRIAIVVKASPEAIFQALQDVALRDMKLAWALGAFVSWQLLCAIRRKAERAATATPRARIRWSTVRATVAERSQHDGNSEGRRVATGEEPWLRSHHTR